MTAAIVPDIISRPTDDPSLETSTAEQMRLTRQAETACALVERVFQWLADDSLNNAGYLTSDAYKLPREWLDRHVGTIKTLVADGIDSLSFSNETFDLYALDILKTGQVPHHNQYKEETQPLPKQFVASDFWNAGIKDVIQAAYNNTDKTPQEVVNKNAVAAIGGMLVRNAYFTELSIRNPETFTKHDRKTFEITFRNNILAVIATAARLTIDANPQPVSEPMAATA